MRSGRVSGEAREERRRGAGGDKAPQCGAVDTTTATHPPPPPPPTLVRPPLISPRPTDFYPSCLRPLRPSLYLRVIVLIQFESIPIGPGRAGFSDAGSLQ